MRGILDDTSSIIKYDMTIDTPHITNRSFKGNPNYLDFYNREVKKFFSKDINENSKLSTSKISASGKVIYGASEEFDKDYGTTWSGVEKEIFFQYLARNSINRVDLIKERLPNKSEVEILNYYNILKNELKRRKLKERRRKKFKIKYGDTEKIHKYIKHSKGLVGYSRIPIAFEVSPYFIKFEEVQSNLISKFERSKSNDENQRFRKFFEQYISHKTDVPMIETQEMAHSRSLNSQNSQQEFNETENLISYETALSLTNHLYKNNTITPLSNLKLVPKLHYKSIVLLEELAKIKLKAILYDIIESKISKNWLNTRKITNELKINIKDVNNSLKKLNKNDNLPTNLMSYFSEIRNTLKIEVVNDLHGDQNIMSTDEYKSYILNKNKPRKNNEPRKSKHMRKIKLNSSNDVYNKDPFIFENKITTSSLMNKSSQIPHISSIINVKDHTFNKYPTEVEEELIMLETDILESSDILNSRIHEHSLLTYLSTNQKNDGTVSDFMFNNEEAFKLLSNWQNELELNKISDSTSNNLMVNTINDDQLQQSNISGDIVENEITLIKPQEIPSKQTNNHRFNDIEVEESLLKNFDYEYSYYSDGDSISI